MNYFKQILPGLLVALVFVGCGKTPEDKQEVYVATLMTHPALDQVIASMKEDLGKEGFTDGKNITLTVKNANGEVNLVPAIVQDAKARKPAVVVAVTTPVAQAFAKNVSVPLVFSAVTDPVSAGVVQSMESVTPNVSGVSDAWPYKAQLVLAKQLVPNATRLGVIYNPGEAASQFGLTQIRPLASQLGLTVVDMPATKTTEVLTIAEQYVDKVDILYLSSDNTVIQALPAALKVAIANKKPLIVGDSGTVEKGGLAAVSVGYAGVGKETGRIVAQFLRGNTLVKPVTAQGDELYLNAATAEKIGLSIPQALLDRAKKVFH